MIEASLGSQEPVIGGSLVQRRYSRWWMLVSTYIDLLGPYYFMALTTNYVVLVRCSRWNGKPVRIEVATPRELARITGYRRWVVNTTFEYQISDQAPTRMRMLNRMEASFEPVLTALTPRKATDSPGLAGDVP